MMAKPEHDTEYLKMVRHVMSAGVPKPDRTGTGTRSVFGYQMRFNLRDGTIPMLTSKQMFVRGIIREIEWYLTGNTNIQFLTNHNVHIWDDWADGNGDLGPVYGHQWRNWPGNPTIVERYDHDEMTDCRLEQNPIDQIAQLIDGLKNNPDGRRHIVTAWNVADLPQMALPPCHYTFQCYSRECGTYYRYKWAKDRDMLQNVDYHNHTSSQIDQMMDDLKVPTRELSLMLNQRSADVALGVPFNIVQYSILMRMIAEVTHHVPGDFIWNGGDVHVYSNHIEGLEEQLKRIPFAAPTLKFTRPIDDIDDFGYDDFVISDYQSHPSIKFPVAV